VKPLVDGVISDFEVTEEMLAYLIGKLKRGEKRCSGRGGHRRAFRITNVEVRAVRDAAKMPGRAKSSLWRSQWLRLSVLDPSKAR